MAQRAAIVADDTRMVKDAGGNEVAAPHSEPLLNAPRQQLVDDVITSAISDLVSFAQITRDISMSMITSLLQQRPNVVSTVVYG
jgi:hypothetical protein